MNKYWSYNKTSKVIPLNTSSKKIISKKKPNIKIKKRKTINWRNILNYIFK